MPSSGPETSNVKVPSPATTERVPTSSLVLIQSSARVRPAPTLTREHPTHPEKIAGFDRPGQNSHVTLVNSPIKVRP